MTGEGDMKDRETARDAYRTARSSYPKLPLWESLASDMRAAMQHIAGHATVNARSACAKIAEAEAVSVADGDGELYIARKITDAIRQQT